MSELEPLISAYAEVYLRLTRTLDRQLGGAGVSFARTKLLICLQKRGPLRGTEIAEFFSQSPRTVTEAIDGLERDGYVERTPDATDRRAKLVRITQKGLEAVKLTEPLRRQVIEQTFGVLDDKEREHFLEMLKKISSAMEDASCKTLSP
ncbi:DNA-binding MarR family transcriptional regulator [Altererythrobacter atlanticus]|uniref:HTH-type transcriptional repressor NicR n=1 Tax=Croceibacterium atlanticum TaxID=1267766 RepID=A0A0F7KSP6_9SPHN|nr:MarR family transcriptional regulator [Croceibacterium atlanticum]AKH42609.1 HTH-type transcriptional repressor NicR [Croceibacterium atlanticum]MBB5731386.1 DNA-binding MarR family transcriptional regulator [Croceibacterium atlanticum]